MAAAAPPAGRERQAQLQAEQGADGAVEVALKKQRLVVIVLLWRLRLGHTEVRGQAVAQGNTERGWG